MPFRVKRVYEGVDADDGTRVLVDRIWPRGLTKEAAAADQWLQDVAPSNELRKWFDHDPARWAEFRDRYFAELEANPEVWSPLLEQGREGIVTLLYSARATEHNQAVALQEFLDSR